MKFFLIFSFMIVSAKAYAETPKTQGAFVFSRKKIQVANKTIDVEIADTPTKRARGLMYRQSLKDGTGMLFVFDFEEPLSFWMKNTFIPLNIGYFDKNKTLIDIQEMKPVESEMVENPPSYPSAGPAQYALEVPPNWFAKNKIKIGAKLIFNK